MFNLPLLLAFVATTGLSAFLSALLTWHYARVRVESARLDRDPNVTAVTLSLGPYPWSEADVALVPTVDLVAGLPSPGDGPPPADTTTLPPAA